MREQSGDRFTKAIEQDIEGDLEMLTFEDAKEGDLLSPELRRAKMKHEMLEAIQSSELSQQIPLAFTILKNQGLDFLNKEEYSALATNLASAAALLETLNLQNTTQNFRTSLGITDRTMEACFTVATAKFNAGLYADALALCVLMLTLVPENPLYWYRAGMAAHNAKKYDLALKAYAAAIELDPTFYEALLFTAECYISQSLYSEAIDALEKAKERTREVHLEESWQQLMAHIEEALKTTT